MLQTIVRIYPHDLGGGGMEQILDRLQGEIGVTGVSLWAAAPPRVQWCGLRVDSRMWSTEGGLFFQPDEKYYGPESIEPVVAADDLAGAQLEQIMAACSERGIAVRLVVSGSRVGLLAERNQDAVTVNAYGVRSRRAICPSTRRVQNLLTGIISDLSARCATERVVVTDFLSAWPDGGSSTFRAPTNIGAIEAELLSICFCESCCSGARAAKVDVAAARRLVRRILEDCVEGGSRREGGVDSVLARDDTLSEFRAWGVSELSSLWERMRESCSCRLLLDHGIENCLRRGEGSIAGDWRAGDIARIGTTYEREAGEGLVEEGGEARISARLFEGDRGTSLVGLFASLAEGGVTAVEVDDCASLSGAWMESIKQAFRFARRSSVV